MSKCHNLCPNVTISVRSRFSSGNFAIRSSNYLFLFLRASKLLQCLFVCQYIHYKTVSVTLPLLFTTSFRITPGTQFLPEMLPHTVVQRIPTLPAMSQIVSNAWGQCHRPTSNTLYVLGSSLIRTAFVTFLGV